MSKKNNNSVNVQSVSSKKSEEDINTNDVVEEVTETKTVEDTETTEKVVEDIVTEESDPEVVEEVVETPIVEEVEDVKEEIKEEPKVEEKAEWVAPEIKEANEVDPNPEVSGRYYVSVGFSMDERELEVKEERIKKAEQNYVITATGEILVGPFEDEASASAGRLAILQKGLRGDIKIF